MLEIYIDGDACPVKQEVYKVAERYGLKIFMVSNQWMRLPESPMIERVVVTEDKLDAADDWIAEHIGEGDIAVTNDVPLAARCVKAGARAVAPNGKLFSEASIGQQLATRDLLTSLREAGEITSGPRAFSQRDRSEFLQALDRVIHRIKKSGR